MRRYVLWSAPILAWMLAGCSSSDSALTPQTPIPGTVPTTSATASLGAVAVTGDLSTSALALYTLTVDPVTLEASIRLAETRTAQANDDLYALSISPFLRADSIRVTGVAATADTIDLSYRVEHPFPAPNNPTGTPNGSTNRADLGIAGMVLLLPDVASATGNTYFTDRVANTSLIANADGYLSPGQLLSLTGIANTFPYQELVDEAIGGKGSRDGISNDGDVTGNYGTDGWTRAEFGPTNDGWTGYGVLHQGQASIRTLSLNKAALSGGVDLNFAIIAKYNDPRGGANATERKANRLPPATADATRFAYRMPHGALDVGRIVALPAGGNFLPNQISSATLSFRVEDWDARATETAAGDLSADPVFTNVAPGESGTPVVDVCIPGILGSATVTAPIATILDDDSAFGGDVAQDSGRPGDGLVYSELVTKAAGSGQVGGDYIGFVRAVDPESGLVTGLDENLQPLASPPDLTTYQAFILTLGVPNTAPTATYDSTSATVTSGGTVTLDLTAVTDPDNDSITVEVDWDNNGTFDVAGTITAPYPASNLFVSPITYTFVGPAPDLRAIPCRISDGIAPAVTLAPVADVEVVRAGWVYTTLANTGLDQAVSCAVDSNGNVYVGGVFTATANFGGGVRTNPSGAATDIFVVKLNPGGQYVWDRVIGSTTAGYTEFLTSLTLDPAGNPLILIHWSGTLPLANWGGTNQVANETGVAGSFDLGVIRMSAADGSVLGLWRTNDTPSQTRFNGALHNHCIDVNAAGEIVIGNVSVASAGIPLPAVLNYGISPFNMTLSNQPVNCVAKLSNAANPVALWFTTLGTVAATTATNGASSAFFEPGGDVIVGGLHSNNFDFGGGPRPTNGATGTDLYITRRAGATGARLWDTTFGSPVGTASEFIAGGDADATRVYFAGQYTTSIQWPGGPLDPAVAGLDPFVAAFNTATGTFAWRQVYGDTDAAQGGTFRDVTVAGTDVYAAGQFGGSVNFGGGVRTTVGSQVDAVLLKLTTTGTYSYDRTWGWATALADVLYGVTVDAAGDPILCGVYGGTVDMDPGPAVVNRTAALGNDMMAIKLIGTTGTF